LKYHPDKNIGNQASAASMYKQISDAYEILSDPKLKKIYDMHGEEGVSEFKKR
jgi:DnaJ-class molecular chaperone